MRLTTDRRLEVIALIEKAQAGLEKELSETTDRKQTSYYICKVLATEKFLKEKQERKQFLEEQDNEEKFKQLLNNGRQQIRKRVFELMK